MATWVGGYSIRQCSSRSMAASSRIESWSGMNCLTVANLENEHLFLYFLIFSALPSPPCKLPKFVVIRNLPAVTEELPPLSMVNSESGSFQLKSFSLIGPA